MVRFAVLLGASKESWIMRHVEDSRRMDLSSLFLRAVVVSTTRFTVKVPWVDVAAFLAKGYSERATVHHESSSWIGDLLNRDPMNMEGPTCVLKATSSHPLPTERIIDVLSVVAQSLESTASTSMIPSSSDRGP